MRRDTTRPGRKPRLAAEVIERVVQKTLHEKPVGGTHWSIRKMAATIGISYTSVQRIWKTHGLKPHLVKTFKLSNDKHFVEKVQDVVGLYVNPPERAVVFSVDEKQWHPVRSGCSWVPILIGPIRRRRRFGRNRPGQLLTLPGNRQCQIPHPV